MSSSSLLLKDLSRFFGIVLLIVGCVGGLLNVVVFVSLKTFRKSACGYYLTLMSIVNVGQLLIDLLNYILKNGYSLDSTRRIFSYHIRVFAHHIRLSAGSK